VVDGELEKLVKYAGFTPQEAIIAATANAAQPGQAKEFGTLEAGKYANMVFLQRIPLQDIGNLRSVVMTVKRGHEFARADYKFTPLPVHED
jgi:imidazolonepropionase-like amidohydrolase